MSFMYNPYPYDDLSAVNRPILDEDVIESLISGTKKVADYLCDAFLKELKTKKNHDVVIALDGYVSADFEKSLNLISQNLSQKKIPFQIISFAETYKDEDLLSTELDSYLREDLIKDPVSLFGKVYDKGFEGLLNTDKIDALGINLNKFNKATTKNPKIVIVYGKGSTIKKLRKYYDKICYFDVTPKESILRGRRGAFTNIGDRFAKPVKDLIRRCYYIDFVVCVELRGDLLHKDQIDYYLSTDHPDDIQLLPRKQFDKLFDQIVKYPFRCKPCYIEGVWGGTYLKKLRHLPDEMVNCAWVFDMIPMEVSMLIKIGDNLFEVPYTTFVQKEGIPLMGEDCVKKYYGYFPIRFNYDDSFHSSGNMSIQVHSGKDYNIENYNEFGRQDESYYVVQTGHHAKTYIGFNENANPKEFIELAKKSEKDHTLIDYRKYVNYVESRPGIQIIIPAGTIHSSGQNQVVLEIGSLTIGSYTYKMYDYLRKDLDGFPRPIHTYHGERVLCTERTTKWVKKNLVQDPILIRGGEGWAEYIIGKNDLLYFELHRLEFEKQIEDDTEGNFHVLALVDGEKIRIESVDHSEYYFIQNYLDIVVVPASFGHYRIINLGNQPVFVHKTRLKDCFIDDNQ